MRKKGGGFIVAGGAGNPVPLDSVFRYSQQKIIIMNHIHTRYDANGKVTELSKLSTGRMNHG